MKKIITVLIMLFGLVALILIGCGKNSGGEKFGEVPDEKAERVAIGTLLINPKDYIGKDVVVEGVIASECPTGGFINVRDKSGGTIYVEMHGADFAPIPQRVNKDVIVKGTVFETEGTPKETKLLGKGLIIK